MKILILDTCYPGFLKSVHTKYPDFKTRPYNDQLKLILDRYFGTSEFYSYNLQRLGWKTEVIVANDEALQKKWAKEHNFKVQDNWLTSKLQMLPYVYKFLGKPSWMQQIVLEQVKESRPDVVYMHDLSVLDPENLELVKRYCKLLVGQIASPLPPEIYLKRFDLIVTSFPHFVSKFRKMGIKSKYLQLAFESRILKKTGKHKRKYDVTFVGSFSPYHRKGTKLLEEVAKSIPIHVWAQGLEFLSPFSPLRKNYHGEAWGLDMFKILAQSKIVINRHIGVSGKYANNMRLYEVTGMGAMLITDKKKNLNELFRVGKEVVEYRDAKDLTDKIKYYLKNEVERKNIAEAGQKRTLTDHNYKVLMVELTKIISKYLYGSK